MTLASSITNDGSPDLREGVLKKLCLIIATPGAGYDGTAGVTGNSDSSGFLTPITGQTTTKLNAKAEVVQVLAIAANSGATVLGISDLTATAGLTISGGKIRLANTAGGQAGGRAWIANEQVWVLFWNTAQ